jgi:phage terminase large subunit
MDLAILDRVQRNPVLFINEALGCNSLESFQVRICEAVAIYDRVCISACHSVGKTFIMGRIVPWFLYCFPRSKVITTAPTNRQVEMLLWGEIGSAVSRAPYNLGGHFTSKKLVIDHDWYAMGFSPQKEAKGESDEQKGSTFQGWHGQYILVVFDEATGIPPDVWAQVEGLLTSGKLVKFVCIGNPTTKNCNFYDCFQMPTWHKIHLSCFDSPNLIANGITNLSALEREVALLRTMDEGPRLERIKAYLKPVPHLVSCQWVIEKALEWGIESPLFQSKCLGQFPDMDEAVLIQEKDVQVAQSRTHSTKKNDARFIGIDVARFGTDLSCWTELTGTVHTRTMKTAREDLMETVGRSVRFIMDDYEGEDVVVCVDATGLGAGVYDRLVELQKEGKIPRKVKLIELQYGASVKSIQRGSDPTKKEEQEQANFLNIKALMYNDLAQALKNELRLRKDSIYNSQLPTIKYKFNSTGKMIIESKEDYKARTGKPSPDEADSLAMANFARRFLNFGNYLRKLL